MQQIDEKFFSPRLPVSIVALQDADLEAIALRAVLEQLGCVVTIHWIGTPSDFLTVLGQGETAPKYLVIACHGDEEKGFYFKEYADFIDTSMLRDNYMPAEVIGPVINLPNSHVISSGCATGVEVIGQAFVNTGKIKSYTGCREYPDANDMLVFLVNFFHSILNKKLAFKEAWQRAILMTDAPEIYQMSLFYPDGKEERFEPKTAMSESSSL